MSYLEKFTKDEQNLIVSLPYRIGIWISAQDNTGNEAARALEIDALSRIIKKKADGMFETAFIHEVMVETYDKKHQWENLSDMSDSVLEDMVSASAIVAEKLGEKDARTFGDALFRIAFEVAAAYSEYSQTASLPKRLKRRLKTGYERLVSSIFKEQYDTDHMLNISYDEDIALGRLKKAMGFDKPAADPSAKANKKDSASD